MNSMARTLAAAAVAGWSTVAFAQQQTPQTVDPQLQQEELRQQTAQIGQQRSANEIIGLGITNRQDEDLGSVDDIILDNQQGRIAYAVVSYGGILGIGEKQFAVPWQAFSVQEDTLILDVAKDRLKDAPGFEKGELPDQADPMFHEQAHEFYGAEPYDVSQRQEPAEQQDDVLWDEGDEADETAETPEAEPTWDWKFWSSRGDDQDWARRLSELIGTQVVNQQNEELGDIDDIVIDTREGRLTFALVNYGGIDAQRAAVPWTALDLNKSEEAYVLDATSEDLEIAKIDSDYIQQLEDQQFSEKIYEAFDVEPYWMAQTSGDARSQQEFWSGDSQGEQISLNGTIESTERLTRTSAGSAAEPGLQVTLRTDQGETETVFLASRQELRRQNVKLSEGDQIQIQGVRTQIEGREVVEATQLNKDGQTVSFETARLSQMPGASEVRDDRASERAQARGSERSREVPEAVSEQQQDQWQSDQSQQMEETPEFAQESVSLKGTVSQVTEPSSSQTQSQTDQGSEPLSATEQQQFMHVQIRTEEGSAEILHFSDAQALRDQNIELAQGQELEIQGTRGRHMGEPVIFVTELMVDGRTYEFDEPAQEQTQQPSSI